MKQNNKDSNFSLTTGTRTGSPQTKQPELAARTSCKNQQQLCMAMHSSLQEPILVLLSRVTRTCTRTGVSGSCEFESLNMMHLSHSSLHRDYIVILLVHLVYICIKYIFYLLFQVQTRMVIVTYLRSQKKSVQIVATQQHIH